MKAAILGAGFIAQFHAEGYLAADDVTLCAVCDTDEEKARALARRYDCAWYTDASVLLRQEHPDLVSVCLPTYLHREYAVMALEHGAHVLCEKPLALTIEDCLAMQQAAAHSGRQLMTAQVLRWWPEYVSISDEMRRLGVPLYIHARRFQHASSEDRWHLQRDLGGGALFDLFVHDMDFLLGQLGTDAEVVSANGSRGGGGSWRRVTAALRWANGACATVEACNQMPLGYPFTASLHAQYPQAAIDYSFRTAVNLSLDGGAQTQFLRFENGNSTPLPQHDNAQAEAFKTEIRAFVSGVRAGSVPLPLEESIAVMRVILRVKAMLDTQEANA